MVPNGSRSVVVTYRQGRHGRRFFDPIRFRREGKGEMNAQASRGEDGERKGTNRYHFGVIGTGRGINVLNPLFVLHCIYDDNCKYIDDTSTSAPPEALLLRNLYYNRYTSRVSLYYSEKGRERE